MARSSFIHSALTLFLTVSPAVSTSAEVPARAALDLSFVPASAEPAFGVGGSGRELRGGGEFLVLAGAAGAGAPPRAVAPRGSDAIHSADGFSLPRPPAPSALRTLTLAIGLLGQPAGGAGRLGRWQLEALVAEESSEGPGARDGWRSGGQRELAVRLRGSGLSQRMRATVGVNRVQRHPGSRRLEWTGGAVPATEMVEALEASYDLVRNQSLWDERAASLTVSARRSEFAAPVSDPRTAFPDTDELFAAADGQLPAMGFALARWRVPGAEKPIDHRVAEEIAAANLKLSLFPWLTDPSEKTGWHAAFEQGFGRVRPWRAGRAGESENVHTIGGSWSSGSNRLGYRHEVVLDGNEAGRTRDEITVGALPLDTVVLQLFAARTDTPERREEPAEESLELGASASWSPGEGWSLWSDVRSGDGRCGVGCESTFQSAGVQLSRQLGIVGDGRRLPVRVYAGAAGQRIASAKPGLETTDELFWSMSTGLSVTF